MKGVVVLGMHRSGTSAVTGALAGLGLFPGAPERLVPPDRHNPKGYFEHADVVRCNETIVADGLKRLVPADSLGAVLDDPETLVGLSWVFSSWIPPGTDPLPPSVAAGVRDTVSRISAEAPGSATWVLKDPRFAFTLHHWLATLEVPAAVAVVRSPAEIAYSLLRRDAILPGVSHDLWALHVSGIIRLAPAVPTLVVDYGLLLDSPERTLAGIAGFLSGRGAAVARDSTREAAAFLSPSLRHRPPEAIDVPAPLAAAYESLRAAHLTELAAAGIPPLPPPDPQGWLKALYLAVRNEKEGAVHRLRGELFAAQRQAEVLAERLHGLNLNRLTGPAVRLLRALKGDPSIGDWRIGRPAGD